MKKTIKVQAIKERLNQCLKHSTCEPDVREGMILALEEILFSTDNYNGYYFLREDDGIPTGHLPGINYEVNTSGFFSPCEDYEKRFFNTDKTRRQYY